MSSAPKVAASLGCFRNQPALLVVRKRNKMENQRRAAELELQALIAMGDFSTLFLAHRARDADLSAVKCFSREQVRANALSRRVQGEKSALALVAHLPHPFVLRYLYTHYDAEKLYLGMEYVGGCDLFTLVQNKGPLTPNWTRMYAAEMCLALGHLHSFDLIFRDLKPENVSLCLDGHAKLTGFGSALKMYGRCGGQPPTARPVSLSGTPEFLSPEILLGAPTCEVSDWWSFGCFVSELLTGSSPFTEDAQDIQALVWRILHVRIDAPEHPHVGFPEASFLEALLVRDPSHRLGARPHGHKAVLAHKWFAGISAERLLRKQLPAPWLPHRNGPLNAADRMSPSQVGALPEAGAEAAESMPTGDETAYDAEASGHAQGALVEATHETVEPEELACSPTVPAGWGAWADVLIVAGPTSSARGVIQS